MEIKRTYIDAAFGIRIPKFMENGAVALFSTEEGVSGYFAELFEPGDEVPYWSTRRDRIEQAVRAAETAAKKPPSFYKEKQS
jgi:hypothetical protein